MSKAVSTWRGRPLPRPTDDLEDQGLGFDVQTVLDRRSALRVLGLGSLALGLAACTSNPGTNRTTSATTATPGGSTSATTAAAGEIPDETAGPFPGDGSNGPDVLEESGVIRSDIRSSFGEASGTAQGLLMNLELGRRRDKPARHHHRQRRRWLHREARRTRRHIDPAQRRSIA